MSDDFRKLVMSLWASLGLAAPAFRTEDRAVLNIDGHAVELTETPDGSRILVTGSGGRLFSDPARRTEQIRFILGASLGTLAGHPACVSISRSDPEAILVQGTHAYRSNGVAGLTELIQGVVAIAEALSAEWKADGAGLGGRKPLQQAADESIIFRP